MSLHGKVLTLHSQHGFNMDLTYLKDFKSIQTPFYFYDFDLFKTTVDKLYSEAKKYGTYVHYAVKANAEKKLLQHIAHKGFGADCVSGNEIKHCIDCGFSPTSIVFAGVGKTDAEINTAIDLGIGMFNCESIPELKVIAEIAAQKDCKARISLRINPNIDAHTHEYITTGLEENKFGISDYEFEKVIDFIKNCNNIEFKGLHFHIGSQITDPKTIYKVECERACEIVNYFESKGLIVENINLGGGLGIDYDDPNSNPIPDFASWLDTISNNLPLRADQKIHIEPGRSIVAQCGTLISRVVYVKDCREKSFLILDAGMNDLIRPALYGAYHKIENLSANYKASDTIRRYDVVGPICESSDIWSRDCDLPESNRGDIIAIRSAGAYGATMSSRYNLRDIAPAVFSDMLA